MAKGYVAQEKERDILIRLEKLEEDWSVYKTFIRMGENPETVSLKRLIEFYEEGVGREQIAAIKICMATPILSISSVLKRVHSIIMDWDLEVDENITVPEALAAAKKKQPELLSAV